LTDEPANRIVVMMKSAVASNGGIRLRRIRPARLRMTKRLAEKRSVGDAKAPKFDGVKFLRSLRK